MTEKKEDDEKSILLRLSGGDYYISDFYDGKGFCNKKVGGCWGMINERVLKRMVKEELITEYGTILRKGFKILGEE